MGGNEAISKEAAMAHVCVPVLACMRVCGCFVCFGVCMERNGAVNFEIV
jgi:hypothetical protein